MRKKLFCGKYETEVKPGVPTVFFKYNIKSFSYVSYMSNFQFSTCKSCVKFLQDSEEQSLSVTSWMILNWQDDRLKFNEENKELNVKYIHIDADHLWHPDIYLYNSVVKHGIGTCHTEDCIVYPSGKVACV